MFNGIKANGAQVQGIPDRAMKVIEVEGLKEPQDLHVLSFSRLTHTGLKEATQGYEHIWQIPQPTNGAAWSRAPTFFSSKGR